MALLRNGTTINHLDDTSIHGWYRFVLAFPDHLVSNYLDRFGIQAGEMVLDPFVGTGTTLVECKKRGIHSVGVDANPVTAFASQVKTNWDIDLDVFCRRRDELLKRIRPGLLNLIPLGKSEQLTFGDLASLHEPNSPYVAKHQTSVEEIISLVPKNAISPLPLEKIIVVRQAIFEEPLDAIRDIFLLALASTVVSDASNLGFGPEVYVSKRREDADVYQSFADRLLKIENDLRMLQTLKPFARSQVFCEDARTFSSCVTEKVDAVITSPPYPNEKDYTRITRLEMVLLGFVKDKKELRELKQRLLRSNTRNIYVKDDDSQYALEIPEIKNIADEIERRRIERGANSGFERLYARVTLEYFGGMYRVLGEMERVMRSGAQAAIVVGDQMSYFQVPIKTAELLASLIQQKKMPYRVLGIEEFRTRKATATKMDISETVLIIQRN